MCLHFTMSTTCLLTIWKILIITDNILSSISISFVHLYKKISPPSGTIQISLRRNESPFDVIPKPTQFLIFFYDAKLSYNRPGLLLHVFDKLQIPLKQRSKLKIPRMELTSLKIADTKSQFSFQLHHSLTLQYDVQYLTISIITYWYRHLLWNSENLLFVLLNIILFQNLHVT